MYGSARTISNLEGSPSRSPRLPRSPRLGHRRTSSGGGGGTGKTLSMENIQSLNAAYATSGPMYLSDHEGVASTTFPKGTMTLGRATNRAVYGGRVTAMGSSPNIASAGLSHTDVLSYTDQHGGLTTSSHHHHHQVPSMLRQVRDSTMLDLQAQLKDLQRENDLLRKELDIKDSKLGSSMNSIKTFWSPELKKERVLRKEEAARMSVLKEQMRVSHEENQVSNYESFFVLIYNQALDVLLLVLYPVLAQVGHLPQELYVLVYLLLTAKLQESILIRIQMQVIISFMQQPFTF